MPILIFLVIFVAVNIELFKTGWDNPIGVFVAGIWIVWIYGAYVLLKQESKEKAKQDEEAKKKKEREEYAKKRGPVIMEARKKNPYAFMRPEEIKIWTNLHEHRDDPMGCTKYLEKVNKDRAWMCSWYGGKMGDLSSNVRIANGTKDREYAKGKIADFYRERDYCMQHIIFEKVPEWGYSNAIYADKFHDIYSCLPNWNRPESLDELQGEDKLREDENWVDYIDYYEDIGDFTKGDGKYNNEEKYKNSKNDYIGYKWRLDAWRFGNMTYKEKNEKEWFELRVSGNLVKAWWDEVKI